jgi:hypothetical protein
MHKKRLLILDTPEHVDSENIKLKIGSRISLLYQLFSKRDFKNLSNVAKIGKKNELFRPFLHFSGRTQDRFRTNTVKKLDFFKKFNFWSILANFSHIL